jgi:O-succinylbenzoate synthase
MSLRASLARKTFHFGFEARTSRGIMRDRTSWFLRFSDDKDQGVEGIGECAPLPGLSPDWSDDYGDRISKVVNDLNERNITQAPRTLDDIHEFARTVLGVSDEQPSIMMGIETGLLDLAGGGNKKIFESGFVNGKSIPINGLIWMGGMDFVLQQIEIKIRDGFRCIKIKVGGTDFEKECDILKYIRRKYFREDITIRLDANGAFKPDDALYKLQELSKFSVHSIEQPLKRGSAFLPELCATSPIPIGLDEELIGCAPPAREDLLQRVKPQFIILKPTLHGGLTGTAAWIRLAQKHKIGWWLTSALESCIGLNALAQFVSQFDPELPQGLGTGTIYTDNFQSPIAISGQNLAYNPRETWEIAFD